MTAIHHDEIPDDLAELVIKLHIATGDDEPMTVDSVLVLWRGIDSDGTDYYSWHAAGDRKTFQTTALLETTKLNIFLDARLADE